MRRALLILLLCLPAAAMTGADFDEAYFMRTSGVDAPYSWYGVKTTAPNEIHTINLGFTGSTTIDWGDGQQTAVTTLTNATWTNVYASAGTYTVKLYAPEKLYRYEVGKLNLQFYSQGVSNAPNVKTFNVNGTIAGGSFNTADISA